jgi:hypothetical protein
VTDEALWWIMLTTGVAAAAASITASVLDRRDVARPTRRQRYLMHMLAYGLMGISMLTFVLRGFLNPS